MAYSDSKVVRGIYASLVQEFGGGEAVAALLGVSKATVSKQLNENAEIAFVHVAKVEDAVGRYPLTDMLDDRRGEAAKVGERARLAELVGKELGDVPAALVRLVVAGDKDSIRKEAREAMEALERLVCNLDADE
ncbi:hypothetical protein [Pseudooceanicola sp. MF1-13]|uniref:hypothetical protein n=1 Tax=Pseudooceanicola sp. MF1-13 TaxID=3379095 RepID=UPI00389199A6